jgi:hypothetical protein
VSVLVIGEEAPDSGMLKELVGSIKTKYNFTIIAMPMSWEFFEQQAAAGLYVGRKTSVLFEK